LMLGKEFMLKLGKLKRLGSRLVL